MNQNNKFDDLPPDVLKAGLARAADTLYQTQTSVESNGVKVTVSAEPRIIDIHLPEDIPAPELSETLRNSLNQALAESAKKVIGQAMAELENV
jgi:DNA-binding protein YbaB